MGSYNTSWNQADKTGRFLEECCRQLSEMASLITDTQSFAPSESQINVILDEMRQDNGLAQTCPMCFDMPAGFGVDVALSAIKEVISAHPVLTSRCTVRNGNPWMEFGSEPEIVVKEDDGDMSGFYEPFDKKVGLSRFWIVNLGDHVRIYVNVHHCIFDLGSKPILERDLIEAAKGMRLTRDNGYLISADRDRRYEGSDAYQRAAEYAEEMFSGIDTDSVPVGDTHDSKPSCIVVESPVKVRSILALCEEKGITPNAFFASAYAYALSRFNGTSSVVFCMMNNGREESVLRDSIGMFARIVPVALDCGDRDVAGFLRDSADRISDSMFNSMFPFREYVKRFFVSGSVQFQ